VRRVERIFILYVSDTQYTFAYFAVKTKAHNVCLNSIVEQYIIAKLRMFFYEPPRINVEI